MKIRRKCAIWLACLATFPLLAAETNYLDIVMGLSPEKATEYIRSLPADAVWMMASQAYEKGLNEYAISVGILQQAFGPKWEKTPPTKDEIIDPVIRNQKLHPGLRGSMAAAGMEGAKEWNHEDFLNYFDIVVAFYKDEDIEYRWKTSIPDYAARGIGRRIDMLLQSSAADRTTTGKLDQLHAKTAQFMEYLITVLKHASDAPECALEGGGIIDFIRLYLEKERMLPPTEASKKAVRLAYEGREALVQVLRDSKYSPDVAKGVLRRGREIKLSEVLTQSDLTTMKCDSRFLDQESCKLLNVIEQEMKEANKKPAQPSDTGP